MKGSPGPASLREFRILFKSGTIAGLSDSQLLERFLGGGDEGGELAFAALVARHGPMVLGVCRRALSDPEDAADAFQATFLILVKRARSVRVDDSLGRWLYGVSRKVAGRARVVAARRPKVDVGEIECVEAPSPDPDRFELLALLDEELGRLPQAFRSAIVLCDLGGLTHEEAARDLRCPVGTIKSRLARARKRLRERLERRGLTPSAMALAPAVPASLIKATARVSWMSAISGPSTAGVVPAASVILAQEVLKAMAGFQFKLAAAAVLSMGILATGAGVLARGQEGENRAKTVPGAVAEDRPRVDDPSGCVIAMVGDRVTLDGHPVTLEGLTEALKPRVLDKTRLMTTAFVEIASDQKYKDVIRAEKAIEAAGITNILFRPAVAPIGTELEKMVRIAADNRTVADILDVLLRETGLKVVFYGAGVRETARKPVTIEAQEIRLKVALKLLLEPLQLAYRVEDDNLVITQAVASREQSLEQMLEALQAQLKKLEKAKRIAKNASDPAVLLAAREVAEIEAEIERLSKTPPGDRKASPAPYRPQPAEERGRMPQVDRHQATKPPRELAKVAMPEYVIEPPDIITVDVLQALPGRPITGERLVRPDGSINLGYYGEVSVSGLKLSEIKEKIAHHLLKYLDEETLGLARFDAATGKKVLPSLTNRISVDVVAYNSKVYYVQGEVSAPGRIPSTGNDTVLDAINYAGGLLPTASKDKIQLVRPNPPEAKGTEMKLDVNLDAIIKQGDATTNYQLFPGDRLVVYRDEKATPEINPLAKPEGGSAPDVEARLESLERKLDEILKTLGRQAKP
jgi:RNA polymerase sigma factor (sigma-70 family)